MKKTILIIGIVVVIALGIFIWWYFQSPSGSPQATDAGLTGALPPAATTTAPISPSAGSSTIIIGTPQGAVTVNNFHKTAILQDEEYITFADTPTYKLLYDTDHSSFVVSISAGPLATTRPAAEAALLSALGVSETDACKLAVTVGIEPSVDPAFEHQGLTLSFCK